MRVSIRKTFKNVFSQRYNKTNLLMCALLIIVPQAIGLLIGKSDNALSLLSIVAYLIIFVSFFAIIGNTVSAIRNAMFNKKNIFPSVFDSFFQKFLKGILFIIGDTLSNLIANLLFIAIMIWLIFHMFTSSGVAGIAIILAIIVLSIIIAMTHTLVSMNYTFDLKFGSFFKYKEIFSNLRKHCGLVILFSIKGIFVFLAISIPIILLFFIAQLPFYSMKEIIPNFIKNSQLIQEVTYLAFMPFLIDLSGQLGSILFAKKIEKIKEKILKKKNAKTITNKEQ